MGAEPVQDWQKSIASALDWWRDAGVDMLVEEAPRDWMARVAPRSSPEPVAPDVAAAPVEALPDTLEAFLAWRLGDAAPEAEWMTARMGPSGPADAEYVLLTDMPEPDDDGALMSGATGRLLDRMLGAIGIARESVYLASVAVARPLTGQIPGDQEAQLVALARHHLTLLKPSKLLLLGKAAGRILPGTSGSAPANGLHRINYFGAETKVVATYHPRFLLDRPATKSEAWKHLLLFNRGLAE